jgi:hypothetical protein
VTEIYESLLEMHFHSAIIELFKSTFGAKFLQIIKPSPQEEAWLGFDQGFVRTKLTTEEFKEYFKSDKLNNHIFFGYFLQFKIVEKMIKKSKFIPETYTKPYFRSKISNSKHSNGQRSQHEILYELNGIHGASVFYACPMLFNREKLWEKPNLDHIRFVDIATAPGNWSINSKHHICFQNECDDKPLWCSIPHLGKSISSNEWIKRIKVINDPFEVFEQIKNYYLTLINLKSGLKKIDSLNNFNIIDFGSTNTEYKFINESLNYLPNGYNILILKK